MDPPWVNGPTWLDDEEGYQKWLEEQAMTDAKAEREISDLVDALFTLFNTDDGVSDDEMSAARESVQMLVEDRERAVLRRVKGRIAAVYGREGSAVTCEKIMTAIDALADESGDADDDPDGYYVGCY